MWSEETPLLMPPSLPPTLSRVPCTQLAWITPHIDTEMPSLRVLPGTFPPPAPHPLHVLSLFFTTFKAKAHLFHQEVITALSPLWQPQSGLEFAHNPQTVFHLLLEDSLSYSLSEIKTFVYLIHFFH